MCCACVHQLLDMCTTADVRAHNSCCAVEKPLFSEDFYYSFQRLLLLFPTTSVSYFKTIYLCFQYLLRFLLNPYPYSSEKQLQSNYSNKKH